MKVTGTVVDLISDEPLPGASVTVVNSSGSPLKVGMAVNEWGEFELDSPLLNDNKLLFTHAGYQSVIADPFLFSALDYPEVALDIARKEEPEVVVTATIKKHLKKNWGIYAMVAALLLAVASQAKKKKKSIGEMGQKEWISLAIKVGIGVAAYFLIVKPILVKVGILQSKEEKQVDDDRQSAIDKSAAEELKKKPPTFTDAILSSMADTLFESMRYSYVDDDYDEAETVLKRAVNDSDVYRLIQLFGVREECLFGILCTDRTLPQWVKRNLTTSMIKKINDNYAAKNINYRW
jgi:hypothetical protein